KIRNTRMPVSMYHILVSIPTHEQSAHFRLRMMDPTITENQPELRSLPSRGLALKRATDLLLCVGATVLLSPAMLAVAAAIKIDSPGPVLFRQKRVGVNGRYFEILKFRSMQQGTPDLPTDQMMKLPSRVTRVGHFLRSTSLDELPQLFNVI